MKSKKIASKVTLKIALGILLIFVVLTTVIADSLKTDLIRREQEKLSMLSTENASIARESMETMLNQQAVLINAIKGLNGVEDAQRVRILKDVISNTKMAEDSVLSLFYIAEPNAFLADTPNGFSIYATAQGTVAVPEMYRYANKELYQQVKSSASMAVVDPFSKTIDGQEYTVLAVILPIFNAQNQFIGVVGSNIDIALLNQANYNDGGFSTFSTQIICGHQTVITDSKNPDFVGKPYRTVSESRNSDQILDIAKTETPLSLVDTSTDGAKYYASYVPFYLKGSSVVWISGTSITKAEFDAQIAKQLIVISLSLVAGFALLLVVAYVTINRSLRPIRELEKAVEELSMGNLQYDLAYRSNDELGRLADSLRLSTTTLYAYVADIDRAMSEMANGNFDLAPSQPFIGDFKNIEASIARFIQTMSSTLWDIKTAADQVSAGSTQVADGAQALAQSATQQASSVDVLSRELTEVSDRIKFTSENASSANEQASAVGEKIHASNDQMAQMSAAMSEISKSSEEIGKIIKTIEDIAFQTNILALNAAVEAARAGAAGKGFAVVADEVRNLANKSSEAAQQTGTLIESSVNSVRNGVQIAQETADSLVEVVAGAEEITRLIEEISHQCGEQTSSVEQISVGVDQISAVVQMNSATSEESAAASEELSGQADMMKSLVSQFRLKSDHGEI